MNKIYDTVPDIISGKDLDYLSDMFNWHYGAYKSTLNAINEVKDEELKEVLKNSVSIFKTNLEKVLNILSNGGSNE